MNSRFDREKQNRLELGKDLSKKGCIDEPIVDLVTLINGNPDYYTTSSCSGRIIIVANNDNNVKKGTKWLYVSHIFAKTDDIMNAINVAINGDNDHVFNATFKFEPFILHVCCNGLSAAKLLQSTAVCCGYRNSGISMGKSERIICAIRSCHSLEVPIISENKLIVSHSYIEHIAGIANTKLTHNFDAIRRFQLSLNDKIVKR